MRSVIVVVALIVLWGIHRKRCWSARESPEALKTMPYNTRVAMSLAVSVAALLTGAPVAGQSVEREMVVSVIDQDRTPVMGLTASDFTVLEDGQAREVLRVRQDIGGRQIALLVDTSQEARRVISDFKSAASQFIEAMSDGNEISIISFGGLPRIVTDPTTDLERLQDGVGKLFAVPGTANYMIDAVFDTTQGFARRESEHPVVVVLTTLGVDYSNRDARPTMERLREAGVAMYTVVLVRRPRSSLGSTTSRQQLERRALERDTLLDEGPRVTGGRRRDLQSEMGSGQAMQDLANDLRNQYVIVYSRPNSLIPPDRIEVEVNREGVDARGTPINVESGS